MVINKLSEPVKMKVDPKHKRVGFLRKDKQAMMPVGQTMPKHISFTVGKTLPNGTIVVTPIEGKLKGKTCILSETTEIMLDVGIA